MNKVTYEQDSLTLSNVCPECIAQETLCVECVETADARLTDKAYEAASEGNLMYKSQWLYAEEPSGHDWVSSTTVLKTILDDDGNIIDHIVREEYKLPIVMLQDGGELDNVWSLEDYTQSRREVICPSCNLATPKMFNQCQCCDATLEHNVVSISLMKTIVDMVLEGEDKMTNPAQLVEEEDCPCFMGGSCPTDYEHK